MENDSQEPEPNTGTTRLNPELGRTANNSYMPASSSSSGHPFWEYYPKTQSLNSAGIARGFHPRH